MLGEYALLLDERPLTPALFYSQGDTTFYGAGKTVDTTKPFTIVTQVCDLALLPQLLQFLTVSVYSF